MTIAGDLMGTPKEPKNTVEASAATKPNPAEVVIVEGASPEPSGLVPRNKRRRGDIGRYDSRFLQGSRRPKGICIRVD